MKKYSRPCTSPGRGRRVVTETDSQICGQFRLIARTTVLLPTPDGPDSTVRPAGTGTPSGDRAELTGSAMPQYPRPRVRRLAARSDVAEFLLQRDPLVRAEPADAARLSDAQPLHDLLGAYLTHAGHGLKQRRDLHLPDDVVNLTVLENLVQRRRGVLELVLDLGTLFASLSSLLKRGGPLVGGHWRKSAWLSPRGSYRKTLFARGN